MKFGISCNVDSKIFIGSGLTIVRERKRFIFYADSDTGFLNQLRVISEVDDPSKYFLYENVSPQDRILGTNFNYEAHIKDELVRDLQRLESVLALGGNLKRVNWQKSTLEYYPETEEEHTRVQIVPSCFFLWEFQPDDPTTLSHAELTRFVVSTETVTPLIVPMAFYREGRNDYRLGRYISAFFNFYFVIEGLFGNGQWRTDDVIRELTGSKEFVSFVEEFLALTGKGPDGALSKVQLEAELKKKSQPYTAEGLIKLMVKTRGARANGWCIALRTKPWHYSVSLTIRGISEPCEI